MFCAGLEKKSLVIDISENALDGSTHADIWKLFRKHVNGGGKYKFHGNYIFSYHKWFELGKGSHAKVYLGYDSGLKIPVAIKKFNEDVIDQKDFFTEYENIINDPYLFNENENIVCILNCFEFENCGYIHYHTVMKLYEVPLDEFLKNERDEKLLRCLVLQVVNAVAFLHGQGKCHRDLKPGNVLMSISYKAKLADFGSSRKVSDQGQSTDIYQQILWRAPELLPPSGRHVPSPDTDVYSLILLIFYILMNGKHPLCDLNNSNIDASFQYYTNIKSGVLRYQLQDEELQEKLENWIGFHNRGIRPSARALYEFLRDYFSRKEAEEASDCTDLC